MLLYFLIGSAGVVQAATVTETVTSWATPTTQTIRHHPCDVVSTGVIGTVVEWPFTTTSTATTGCVTQSSVYPAGPSSEPTTTATVTVTRSSTVYETRFDGTGTPVTRHFIVIDTTTEPTGRTLTSTKCTNTFIVSFYSITPRTTTRTVSRTATWKTLSPTCMTTTTRWAPLPSGVSFPQSSTSRAPATTPWWDPIRFSNTNLLTRSEAISRVVTETSSIDVMTYTTEVCDNPSEHTVQTYFTRTVYVSTSTFYSLRTDCASASTTSTSPKPTSTSPSFCTHTPTPATPTPTPSPLGPTSLVLIGPAATELASFSDLAERKRKRQMPIDPPARTPIEVHTITITTTGVSQGKTGTYTLTGVAETYLWMFTTVQMVGATVTATDTVVRWVCELPATSTAASSSTAARETGTGV